MAGCKEKILFNASFTQLKPIKNALQCAKNGSIIIVWETRNMIYK